MLFHAPRGVKLPPEMPAQQAEGPKGREGAPAQELRRGAGRSAGAAVLDMADARHGPPAAPPRIPAMAIRVAAPARRPSVI